MAVNLKPLKHTWFLLLVFLLALGCGGSGGSDDDASDACEGLCDEYDDCNLDVFGGEACEEICDEVDDGEDEVSDDCEEAIADLFNCAADQSCDELADLDVGDIESVEDLLDAIFEKCDDEAEDVRDECEGEL